MIVISGRMIVRAEKYDEFLELYNKLITGFRNQPGCTEFFVYRDIENERAFCFVSEWQDRASVINHIVSAEFELFLNSLHLLDSPPAIKYDLVVFKEGLEAIIAERSNLGYM